MRKRKVAVKMGGASSLPELLSRLELALVGMPDRKSVCKALLDLNRALGSVGETAPRRSSRSTHPRRQRQTAVESLSLFS
ncbi:hypothetical protein SAMN02787142_6454 [Burkholderia sp. WP9]|jgi:hypothetical protein|uniref:hypothetical protein n=1 Tax=Burkholderia sp. WP9 TaxID=1500263 RepID=UPI0008988707|nr:hypothetical protein [Burkholderia sp. WP9]SEF00817.1 hypothetical protein SAMN02787142_6454 [Burkholderia sp. WP9]